MKQIILCICLLLSTSVTAADQPTNDEQLLFTAWCDAFTAEGLVSLAANRIFGNITTLSDEEYAKRSEWVDDNYGLAADRFTNRTGHDFQKIYQYALENDWVQHCQFEDVIQ